MGESELKYTNINLFYKVFYSRLFGLINLIVDENSYNIRTLKEQVKAFTDDYSYYIIGKKIKTKDEVEKETPQVILDRIVDFNSFTNSLKSYPSQDFKKIRLELLKNNLNISKISEEHYNILLNEYYDFYNDIAEILSTFFKIASENGFLPKLNSAESLRRIGWNNYDFFFQELEELKQKLNTIALEINVNSILKSRRCMFIILELFKPYFSKKKIGEDLSKELNFDFLKNRSSVRTLYRTHNYESIDKMGVDLQNELTQMIKPLKQNVSLVRRYLSFEFGESKMAPKLQDKYDFDPTGT